MGSFGYICKGCGTAVRGDYDGGENCILIHVRHGKELGRVEGHYNTYGSVSEHNNLPENEKYRGDCEGVNSHDEICASEFERTDSLMYIQEYRMYRGKQISFSEYIDIKAKALTDKDLEIWAGKVEGIDRIVLGEVLDLTDKKVKRFLEMYAEHKMYKDEVIRQAYRDLPIKKLKRYSGTVAWHVACYKKASEEARADLKPSERDPNQSWGKIRKKYA